LVAISTVLSAENQKITIKSSTVQDKVLLLEADLAGKSTELECFLSVKSCTALAPGDYLMVRLMTGGSYQDCQNVEIYSPSGKPTKDKPLGEYCLLES
jgi:hypothetical protein